MAGHELYVKLEDSVVLYTTLKAVQLRYASTHRAWVPRRACLYGGRLRTGSTDVSVAQWFIDMMWRGALAKERYVPLQDCKVILSRWHNVLIGRGPTAFNQFTCSVPRLFCWRGESLACGDTAILVAPAFLERHRLFFLTDPAVERCWAGERPTKWRRFTRLKSKPGIGSTPHNTQAKGPLV
jgi:hypothetical protein